MDSDEKITNFTVETFNSRVMKTLSKIAFLAGLLLTVISCEEYLELDLDDLDGGSSELVGTWDITSVKTSIYQSMVLQDQTEEADLGTLTFNSNGSGSYAINSTDNDVTESGSFDWFENDDKVIMNVLTLSDSITSDNLAIAWEVIVGGDDSQEWGADFSYYSELDVDPYGNPVDWTDYLMKYEIRVTLRKQ